MMANFNSQLDKLRISFQESPSKGFIVLVDSVSAGKSNEWACYMLERQRIR